MTLQDHEIWIKLEHSGDVISTIGSIWSIDPSALDDMTHEQVAHALHVWLSENVEFLVNTLAKDLLMFYKGDKA